MPVGAGEAFSFVAQQRLEEAVHSFEQETGMAVSVYVGGTEGDVDAYADALVARLPVHPQGLVLLLVDPGRRRTVIRTADAAVHRIDDAACALAVLSMTTSFGVGDLVGGLVNGLRMLAEAAAEPVTRHGRPAPTASTVTHR